MRVISLGLISVVILMLASCDGGGPSGPSSPVQACAELGSDAYNCNINSPGTIVMDGKGSIIVSVAGDNAYQFSQVVTYKPNNYNTPGVTLQNSTVSGNTQKIVYSGINQSQLRFETPFDDSYTIKVYFIEYGMSAPSYASSGNTSTCFNPVANGCFRWYKMESLARGTRVTCTADKYIINQQDPNGFIGNCY